ncbi:MAG: lamin tail domain-containing protein [Acidobacteriota bacterium]|nr:lamin tail domain-containing protein [Acidobacteriota bacterium]
MKLFRTCSILALLAYAAATPFAAGQVSLSTLDVAYTQDFNALASSGTSSTTPTGWEFAETGTNANSTYAAGDGGSNTGNTYSFGTGTNSERAFGGLQSGSLTPTIGAVFVNNTGQPITSLDVSYVGEQWRLGTSGRAVPDRLDFQYSLNATSVNTGTWVDVDALDFVAPTTIGAIGALDGNAAANRTVVTGTVPSLSLAPGGTVVIRWASFDANSADDGLAVDDFSITPRGGGLVLPSLTIDDVSVMEGDSGTVTATFTVTASTAAHTGISFDIATADGTGIAPAQVADFDYVARAEVGQLITAGTTTYAFEVTVNGDTTVEPTETFFVNLSGASGATIADGQGIGTITNDDEAPPVVSDVVISQVYGGGGNSGAPWRNDFIELFNAGATSVSLTNWSVQYASATSTGGWSVTPLSGTIAPGGYYLIQQAEGANASAPALPTPDAAGTSTMAAGAGKVALVSSTTAIAGACPVSGVVDLVGYGTTANCFEGTAAAPAPSNTTAGFRKRGGCYDSDHNNVDFAINQPGPRNTASPVRSCTPITVAIHDLQGTGLTTPFFDQDVLTTGIVTGKKSNGFFMQLPPAGYDADPMTSEALFVFTGATPAVVAGDEVTARGTATEYFSLTQVESSLPGDLTVVSQRNPLPAPITLTLAMLDPAGSPQQLEPYEGMRMEAALVSVAPTDGFGEIAAVLPNVPRPMREPGIPLSDPVPPDPTSGVPDCCIPRFDGNPERIFIDTDGLVDMPKIFVTSNVTLGDVLGPLDFSFGAYKILPEVPPTVGANMTGVPVPMPTANEFTVAGFNIENFAGDAIRLQKASRAIRELMRSPDVIGHIEILNKPTLQALADQVNNDAMAAGEPNPGYQAELVVATTAGGQPSTQNVGFLVKTSRVSVDSVVAEPAGTYTPPGSTSSALLHDRPPLVLRATVDALGANPRPVIVVVNHLRSFIDIDLVGIEGDRVRAKRTAQAESTAQLLQDLQTDNPGVAVISVGDYNAYEFNDGYTDPMAIITGAPTADEYIVVDASPDLVEPNYVNLTDGLPAGQRYSFIFEGTPQALDHVLVNTVANGYLQGYAIARGNSDFPATSEFTADPTRPERSSDHDMPVAYFRFPPPSADLAVSIVADAATAAAGGSVTYTVTVTNHGGSPAQNVVVSANATTTTYAFMAAGAMETFTFTASIGCDVPNATLYTATASVVSDTADPVPANNSAAASVVVTNAPPTLSGITTSTTMLWPANHKMVDVIIGYIAADQCGLVVTGVSVTSNEPINGAGDGNTAPDWEVVDANLIRLRAERAGGGAGRIYTVTIAATDAAGQATQSSVAITVPHSRK